jgi:hypothetical protein
VLLMNAVAAYRLRLGFGLVLAVCTAGLAIALAGPVSSPLSGWNPPVPMVAVSEARAVAAASADPADLEAAERLTRQTLAEKPGDATAWARLAWIASETGDTGAMLEALDRSYAVAPYGPDITGWRLRFAYGRWGELTPELRRLASEELTVTARHRGRVANAALADVTDPAGRLAFDLTIRRARAMPG